MAFPDADAAEKRHHRAPVGERGLREVDADKQREPEEVRMHIQAEQHACGDEHSGNQTQHRFEGHDEAP